MKKLQFGAAGRKMDGWECHDMDMDIRQPLPFEDGSVTYIHAEHLLEHVTHQEAWKFLSECHRILGPQGKIRLAIPDIVRMWNMHISGEAIDYLQKASDERTIQGAIRNAVFCHGHQVWWSGYLLHVVLGAIGFQEIHYCEINQSQDEVLRNLEQHGRVVGEHINFVETTVIEATK